MTSLNIYFLSLIYSLQLILIQAVNKTFKNQLAISYIEDNISIMTGSIIEHCFENNNVYIRSRKDDFISKLAFLKSLKLFDVNHEIFSNYKRNRNRYSLENINNKNFISSGVIIDILPDMNLIKILEDLRNSIWWNSRSLFILIDRNSREVCPAFQYLKILWDFKIPSALYACKEAQNEVSLYTFNPYANLAPTYWTKVENIENWVLFKLRYQRQLINSDLCSILYFDKEKYLNGYRLKSELCIHSSPKFVDLTKGEFLEKMAYDVFTVMNVTYDIKLTAIWDALDNNGRRTGLLQDILYEEIDLAITVGFLVYNWKIMTYPVYFLIYSVWLRATPINFATKFIFFFKWKFWFVFIVTCTVSIFILKRALHETIGLTIIKFVQAAYSSSNIKEPQYFYPRILLYVVIMVTSTINFVMQLQLTWWSALPKYEMNMQFIEDVVNSNITFYGRETISHLVFDYTFIKKFRDSNDTYSCIDMLNDGKEVACIEDVEVFDERAWWQNPLIYELKQNAFSLGLSFLIAEDFSLRYKMDLILMKLREAGIFTFLYEEASFFKKIAKMKMYGSPKEKALIEYTALKLNEIILCVYVLLGGCTLGLVAFIAECFIHKIKIIKGPSQKTQI